MEALHDNNIEVDPVYNNFAKAFDKVSREIMLKKLEAFNFSSNLLEISQSYLSGRMRYLVYNIYTSSLYKVHRGFLRARTWVPYWFCSLYIICQIA